MNHDADEKEKAHLLSANPPPTVRYFATDEAAIYRIVGDVSGWKASPGRRSWHHCRSHREVLAEVGIHGGSSAPTPRISRAEALTKLKEWGIEPDELDALPEA